MKRLSRIFIATCCIALLAVSWAVVLGAKSDKTKQKELMVKAMACLEDGVYVFAIPFMEEAVGYNTTHTQAVEEKLKETYIIMKDQKIYENKYADLITRQMRRREATPGVFEEAARFYLDRDRFDNALNVLKDGIAKTGCKELENFYEKIRYEYRMGRNVFDEVTEIFNGTIGVRRGDLWGIASAGGSLRIPCEYDKISTFSSGRAIVQAGTVIYAIDSDKNRVALFREEASDFGNYSDGRIPFLTDKGWKLSAGDLQTRGPIFEEFGMFSGGYAAARQNGKWGTVDTNLNWVLSPEFDGIIMDNLGRSYAQDAVFVKTGSQVYLYINSERVGEAYDDAKPFSTGGYAAVKKNGKWGFINISGEVTIEYQFEDALSFGQHLAAVKKGRHWGYISRYGEIVIEPVFLQAKSFAYNSAPVLTTRGWQFITLLEN